MILMTSCWESTPASRPPMGIVFTQMSKFYRIVKTLGALSTTWRAKSSHSLLAVADEQKAVEEQTVGIASNEVVMSDTVSKYDPFEEIAEVEMTSVRSPKY